MTPRRCAGRSRNWTRASASREPLIPLRVTPRTASRITEVKRKLDGSEQRFDCELVWRTPALVVALYRFDSDIGPIDSYGCFWARRPYLCYHMVHRAGGSEWATRFDVIRDMRLAPHEVRYTDLLLDLWSDRDGLRWEDEDEVEAAHIAGSLDKADLATIARARGVLTRRHRTAVREVRGLLRLDEAR